MATSNFILRVGRPKHKLVHLYTLHNQNLSETDSAKYLGLTITSDLQWNQHINTLSAKDGDLRLSASNACLPKTEISVFVTECVFFTSTCYKLHMFTLHNVLYS